MIRVVFFGMIAEALNCQETELDLEANVVDLRPFFEERYPVLKGMKYRFAVNQEVREHVHPGEDIVEIAILPPFAGG